MSFDKKYNTNDNQMELPIDKQIKFRPDEKVKNIYDRFHNGKSITMDDLQYLWVKDPEGFKIITKSIVEKIRIKEPTARETVATDRASLQKETIEAMKQQDNIYADLPTNPPSDLKEDMPPVLVVKALLEKMTESEQIDLLSNLNNVVELQKVSGKLKQWEDGLEEKLDRYTRYYEKEFDTLA